MPSNEPTGICRVFIDDTGWPIGRKILGGRRGFDLAKEGNRCMNAQSYHGYLSPDLDRIREMHEAGLGTREIAEALFAAVRVRPPTRTSSHPRCRGSITSRTCA